MPASDRTSPNPGARLHPHVPRGPGGLKTFALMMAPKNVPRGPGGLKTFALMIAPKKCTPWSRWPKKTFPLMIAPKNDLEKKQITQIP